MGRTRHTEQESSTVDCGDTYYLLTPPSNWMFVSHQTYNPSTSRPYKMRAFVTDELHRGPPYKDGGPFNKWTYDDGGLNLANTGTYYSLNGRWRYVGGFVCVKHPQDFFGYSDCLKVADGTLGEAGWAQSSAHGATAWNRFKPGKPGADLAQFIAEARDVPRMLKQTNQMFKRVYAETKGRAFKGVSKAMANDWLNTQFGWLPFLNDCRKFYKTWRNLDQRIKQLKRDNGRWVRRGGTLSFESEHVRVAESSTISAHTPIPNTYFFSDPAQQGRYEADLYSSTSVWFDAAFRYYIPDIDSVEWNRKAVRLLFGGGITPALLWELTPWSWLVDWFSNVGDIFANMDNNLAENLAAKYAYVMKHVEMKGTVHSVLNISPLCDAHWTYTMEVKDRAKANPFGFDLSWDMLTPRQWSILGALGLSRLR